MTQRSQGRSSRLPVPGPPSYLGPGRVPRSRRTRSRSRSAAASGPRAQMALAFPYAPAEGDVLLVIGKGDEHYVIGVLHGTGKTALSFQGGVEIRATGGPLTLSSDQGVAIRGPEVEIEAGKLQVLAGGVVERFTSLYQRVRDALERARRARRTPSWTGAPT